MKHNNVYLGLDIGARRIGLALADGNVRLAWPLVTLEASEIAANLQEIIQNKQVTDIVVGRPRNQSGDVTAQTQAVTTFVELHVAPLGIPIHWQDESVTSVLAEARLREKRKPYNKAAIDAEAAAIILQDYLEEQCS